MSDTTTQSIRSTGERMGFSKGVIHDAVEEFIFIKRRPLEDERPWAVPDKDWLFEAEWQVIKPKQSREFDMETLRKVDKLTDELDSFMICK